MPTSSPATVAPERNRWLVAVLALLLGVQPVTTDLYLPALPSLVQTLDVAVSQVQLTLTVLLLAFGSSQIAWGPLSDRYGRRPILLFGLALYTLAAVGCAMAGQIDGLVFWRGVQGVAMGSAVACARAIVRDAFAPAEGTRVMAKVLGGLGFFACASPLIGGLVVSAWGWRACMWVVALFGLASLGLVAWKFDESLPAERRSPLHPGTLWRNAGHIVTHPGFLAWCALVTASYAALFTFLASSSFVFVQVWHFSRAEYGLTMAAMSLVYIAGTLLCRRLLPRYGARRTVGLGAVATLAGGTLMGVAAHAGLQTWWAFLVPNLLFMVGHGIHQPCGQSRSVAPFPQSAGMASAINGLIMMVVAYFVGQWIGRHIDGTVFALVDGMWFWCVVIALTAWTVVRRYGDLGVSLAPPVGAAGAGAR